jgi:Uma2 family endonuclease
MMSKTAIRNPNRTMEADGDQCVVFRDIDWKGYSTFLRVRGEQSVPRMIYLDGSLFLVSPSFSHEYITERLGWLVLVLVEELDMPCVPSRSTTFRRRAKRGGVEGDLSYYLANESRVRGKKQINVKIDPPPDLAVEVVRTHDADAALEVYRRVRVPEVWVYEEELTILAIQPDGRYAPIPRSLAFPILEASEITTWIQKPRTQSETAWVKELRRWVAEIIVPRYRHYLEQQAARRAQQTDE